MGSVRQFAEIWWLCMEHALRPKDYYRYQLYLPEQRRRAPLYLSYDVTYLLVRTINVAVEPELARLLQDKQRFGEACERLGLPSIPVLLEIRPGDGVGPDQLPRRDLFSKPVSGSGGRGARRWTWDGERTWTGPDGVSRDAESLLDELRAEASSAPVLVQPCLRNHPEIERLASGALSTVRVITVRPPDGAPSVLLARFRMGLRGSSVDNFSAGGIASDVDLTTGEIGTARSGNLHEADVRHDRHPDTGAPIAGTRLPCWNEVISLVLRAHECFGRLPAIGWDVALTPDGPVLVEGNNNPGPNSAQALGEPLGATAYASCLNAHLRRRGGPALAAGAAS